MGLRVSDIQTCDDIRSRAKVIQKKTGKPVQFEVTKHTRQALIDWIHFKELNIYDWLFPSRKNRDNAMTTRQYGRVVKKWIGSIGLPKSSYATHSLRRTKATLIYRKTGNLRAVQILLGHEKIDSTVKYLGVELKMHSRYRRVLSSEKSSYLKGELMPSLGMISELGNCVLNYISRKFFHRVVTG